MNFHDEIASNARRSWLLILGFFLLVLALGYVLGVYLVGVGELGVLIAGIFAIFYALIGYYSGAKFILAASRAKPVTKKEDPYLVNTVEGLAIAAGIPTPKVYCIEEDSPNAFATGRDPKHALVAVTAGLRKKMNRQELEGVLAHELSHIKNYDIRYLLLVGVLLSVTVLLADMLFRSFWWGGRRDSRSRGGGVIILFGVLLAILAPLIAYLIRFAVSRQREFLADASGAKLTRYPLGLANALKKIRDSHDKVVDTANRATEHLYIENPLRNEKRWLSGMFSTHPDINERIRRLEGM